MAVGNWYAHGVTASQADNLAYIGTNLEAVYARIAQASQNAGRATESVELVAVSKTFPVPYILAGYDRGQRAFGENYLQEAVPKIIEISKLPLPQPIQWHFIGPIQSNKTRLIAEHFSWVHSVDRLKIAERLSQQRPAHLPPLQICLQVNISGEASKAGATLEEAMVLAQSLVKLPSLTLRGLMCIPEATDDVRWQREQFSRLRLLRDRIAAGGVDLDTLSMGMTDDLESAIAEGASMVRVGRAIFGERA